MSKKTSITVSIDKAINDILEKKKINKSKLVDFLIDEFFEKKGSLKEYKKKK